MAGDDLGNQSAIRGKLLDHSLRHHVETQLRPNSLLFGGHVGISFCWSKTAGTSALYSPPFNNEITDACHFTYIFPARLVRIHLPLSCRYKTSSLEVSSVQIFFLSSRCCFQAQVEFNVATICLALSDGNFLQRLFLQRFWSVKECVKQPSRPLSCQKQNVWGTKNTTKDQRQSVQGTVPEADASTAVCCTFVWAPRDAS